MSLGVGIGISAVLQNLGAVIVPGGPVTYGADYTTGTFPADQTFSRASSATYWDSTGTRQTAASNAPRFDYNPVSKVLRGLLIEEQRTNYLLNSTAPVTQTVSLPTGTFTLWMEGSGSVTAAAGTAVGTGFGTATAGALGTYGTTDTFTITTAGTVTFTVSGTVTAFQCEGGGFPTSLIITAGTSATRAPDLALRTGVTSFFNVGGPGTMIAEFTPNVQGTASAGAAYFTNGTNNNLYYALNRLNTGAGNGGIRRNTSVNVSNINGGTVGGYVTSKLGYAWASGDQALIVNGAAVGSSTTADIATDLTQTAELRLGRNGLNQAFLNGWLRKFSYYNSRVTNADLQTLTT